MKHLSQILLFALIAVAGATIAAGAANTGAPTKVRHNFANNAVTAHRSPDGGPVCTQFDNRTEGDGLGNIQVNSVYATGGTIYAATSHGLSVSINGGSSFVNRTEGDGLSYDTVTDVYASGGTLYVATAEGLSISTDGGTTFSNRTTSDGLGSNDLYAVHAHGDAVYVASSNGLALSADGGDSFTTADTGNGLGSNDVLGVHASGAAIDTARIYAATTDGLSISTDGGATFVNRTAAAGLGNNWVYGVYSAGSIVYAATYDGLSISTDGGASFVNRTTSHGLGSNVVYGVYASGSTVYAATQAGLSISEDAGATFANYTDVDGLGSRVVYGVHVLGNSIYAATNAGLSLCTATATIAVSSGGTPITPGDMEPNAADGTDFGTVEVLNATAVHTFTISNAGVTDVLINGVAIIGEHASDFSVLEYPENSLALGESTTFRVAFAPTAAGDRTAILSIASNDTAHNPFTFAIGGEGLPVQNAAPTDIILSSNRVNENLPPGTPVGIFSTVDPDPGDAHSYALIDGATAAFAVVENVLQTAAIFDFESRSSYTLTVRSTDAGGLSLEKTVTVAIDDAEERPVAVDDPGQFPPDEPLVVVGDGAGVPIDVLRNDFSPLGTPLSVGTVSSPTTLGGGTVNAGTAVNYTAPVAVNGADSFLYTASDGASQSDGATVTVNVVANDARGDCNGSGGINDADFTAITHEIFDTDDSPAWWRTFTGSHPGSPRGCDANGLANGADGSQPSVDVADSICAARIAGGESGCSVGTAAGNDAASTKPASLRRIGRPVQLAPPAIAVETVTGTVNSTMNSTVDVPVHLWTNGNDIAGVAFSIDFDETCLAFDATDGDADGVPDAVRFALPDAFSASVLFDAADADGEIDVQIADLAAPVATLSDTAGIMRISFTPLCAPPAVGSTVAPVNVGAQPAPSFSNGAGQPVTGVASDGSVEIVAPAPLPSATPTPTVGPTAGPTGTPGATPTPGPTNTPAPTPDFNEGVPTAITLARFFALVQPAGVLIQWETSWEGDVLSFAVERSPMDAAGAPTGFARITGNVPGRGAEGGVYTTVDASAESGQRYVYRLVARMKDGTLALLGQAEVTYVEPAGVLYLPVIR